MYGTDEPVPPEGPQKSYHKIKKIPLSYPQTIRFYGFECGTQYVKEIVSGINFQFFPDSFLWYRPWNLPWLRF